MSEENKSIEIVCPHCGQVLVADISLAGEAVDCPTCEKSFKVELAVSSEIITDGKINGCSRPESDEIGTSSGAQSEAGNTRASRRLFHFLRRRIRIIAALVGAILLAGFAFLVKDRGVRIPAEQIIRGKRECALIENGKGFRTNGRGLFSFELPLEFRSKRLTFDIRFHQDPEEASNCVEIKTGPYLFAPQVNVSSKGLKLKAERWMPVEVRLDKTEAVVCIDGKRTTKERPVGVGFHTLLFGHGVDYSVRNLRVYPSKRHRKAVQIYYDAISLKGSDEIWKTKLAMFKNAAQLGLADAQEAYALFGSMGFDGNPLSNKEMVEWTRKAAEQGSADAQWGLGNFYFDGSKLPQDDREALKWLRLAADGGKPGAMLNLGILLMRSKVIDKDAGEAQKILFKCHILVDIDKADDLDDDDKGNLYLLLAETYVTGGQGAEIDKETGREYLRKSAQFGNTSAIQIIKNLR